MGQVRICHVCSTHGPIDGPLPYEWDSHLHITGNKANGKVLSELRLSCSPKCRASAGWKERKPPPTKETP